MTGSRKPLKCWSMTLAQNFKELPAHTRVQDTLSEFFDHWMFQLEEGSVTVKEHYQCRGILDEPQMTETLLHIFESRGFDRRDVTVLPESNNSIQQGGLSFYVMKDDTRKAGPWHDPSYKPRKRNTYDGRDLRCMENPYTWQKTVMSLCNAEADDRTINWVYNASGCAGKSKLMKYMRWKNPEMARVGLGSATQIKTAVIEKGAHQVYMVDLPRVRGSDERQQELFSALEEIKNGWVESPMYGRSAELLMEPPHIWIFSNELPNLGMCSLDRWHVWHLYDTPSLPQFNGPFDDPVEGGVEFRKLTVAEVIDLTNSLREAEEAGKKQVRRRSDDD
jgi:hypothetical protein